MKQSAFEKKSYVCNLLNEYKAVSQSENVPFFEEAAFWRIANSFLEDEQPDEALRATENAILHHPKSPRFHIFRAKLMLLFSNLDCACSTLETVRSLVPDELLSLLFRAEALSFHGHSDAATKILNEMLDAFDPRDRSLMETCQQVFGSIALAENNDFDQLAEQAIRRPYEEDILEAIWLQVEVEQNYDDSVALHETILDRHPYCSMAWYNLGFAYRFLEREKEALEAFEYAFICDPEFENAYQQYIELAMQMRRFRSAIIVLEEMMAHFGEEPTELTDLGQCYLELGEVSIAKYLLEKALKIDPYFPDAYYRIGLVHQRRGDLKSAAKWFRQSVQLDGDHEEYAFSLAETLHALGKTEEALEFYWKAVEIDPFAQRTWGKVIRHFTRLQNFQESLEIIEQAMLNCIESNELNYMFSANLLLAGDRRKGLRVLKKAVAADPSKKDILFDLAPALSADKKVLQIVGV